MQRPSPCGHARSVAQTSELRSGSNEEIVDTRSAKIIILTNYIDQIGGGMREVPASQAKTHLPQLLDEVERGETIVITRHGRPIARMVPELERRQDEVDRAIADLQEFGKQTGTATVEEILSLIREGRKY
jgi:prevent-host-death family protein